ncbi:MAG: ABC transporter substrate-binding protein, partial [Thermodesulfobacteriota bacterium]
MIKNWKKILFLALLIPIFLLFGQAHESFAKKAPYKVGALLDLTEFGAPAGVDEKDALLMEVEKINKEGGVNGHPIELVIENSASHPTKAVSGLTKLVTQDKVVAIIGPSIGNTIAAVLPMAEKNKVPVLSLSPLTPEATRKGYKWTFRMPQSDVIVVEKIIDYL